MAKKLSKKGSKKIRLSQKKFKQALLEYDQRVGWKEDFYILACEVMGKGGNSTNVAAAIVILLLSWSLPFYKYLPASPKKLTEAIQKNHALLQQFQNLDILALGPKHKKDILKLFNSFLNALKVPLGKRETSSPVAVSRVMHLLARDFFPIWNQKIARYYGFRKLNSESYFEFCELVKKIAKKVSKWNISTPHKYCSLVKQIDEYNLVITRS
jgi:hypothetical protein